MALGLCGEFPALSPFSIRREKFSLVVSLLRRSKQYRKGSDPNTDAGTPDGSFELNGMTYIPANNDNWY